MINISIFLATSKSFNGNTLNKMINDRKREVERKIGNLCNFVMVIGDKKKSETKVELTTCTEQR